MTWRWWLFTIGVGLVIEAYARLVPGGDVWADRFARTLLFTAAAVIIVRRVRQAS